MEVALRTPKWANDDSKFVEFLSINSSVACLYTTIFF